MRPASISPCALKLAVATCLFSASAPAQTLLYEIDGTAHITGVAGAGDVNGDGFDDILIGSGFGVDEATGESRGCARVISGLDGSVIHSLVGLSSSSLFGQAVAGLGDLDEDGRADFAVAAPRDDEFGDEAGSVFVYSGADASVLWIVHGQPGDKFGWALAGGVDVDGDSLGDLVVGSPYVPVGGASRGQVRVFSGTGAELASLLGTHDNEEFGLAVAGLGDVDGDGKDEIVIGAPRAETADFLAYGRAIVYSTALGSELAEVFGPEPGCRFGFSVAGVGDISGDGQPDFVAGAPKFSGDSGRVVAMLGATAWPIHSVDGAPGVQLGYSVAGLGDTDGDGVRDYLVGLPFTPSNDGPEVGLVAVLSGANGSPTNTWLGSQAGQHLGWSVASAGLINLDPVPDVVLGGRQTSGPEAGEGTALVRLSASPYPNTYCPALPNSQGCTPRIRYSGAPSLSVGDNFVVRAEQVLNNQNGLMFWGRAAADIPFGGGTLCVQPAVIRTPVQNAGGSASGSDCTGTYAFHFSQQYMQEQGVQPGETLYCQFWSRDPFLPPHHIGLTNGLSFLVVP